MSALSSMLRQPLALLLAAAAALAVLPARAETFTFGFSNIQSEGENGAAGNAGFVFTLTPGALIQRFSWEAELTAFTPSWLSELTVDFSNSLGEGVQITPAADADAPGDQAVSGSIDLVNTGLSFRVQADGQLHLNFYDAFDDLAGAPDGRWNSGVMRFTYASAVPEPASFALLGGGLLTVAAVATRRRREVPATG